MSLPEDYSRCQPIAVECADKDKCARYTAERRLGYWDSVCDFSEWMKTEFDCVMFIKDIK